MAIKISGTTVIDDSRNLTNIGTIKGLNYPTSDGAAGQAIVTDGSGTLSFANPGGTLGTLTKSFIAGETSSIALSASAAPAPVVSVTKEVPQIGLSSKGAWDVATTGINYDRHNTAYDTTLTPSSSSSNGIFTLGVGSFDSTDIGKQVEGNNGKAVITAADGSYVIVSPFTDSSSINSGDWKMFSTQISTTKGLEMVSASSDGGDISTARYVQRYRIAAQETIPTGLTFKPDGTKMYIVGSTSDSIHQYSLINAWDISTITYESSFSISSQETEAQGIVFNPEGTILYMIGRSSDSINQYTLDTPWDITTAIYLQNFSVAAYEPNPTGVAFSTDGTYMYITGANSDSIIQYSLSTSWDISTASFTQLFSISAQEQTPEDLVFSIDGTKLYIIGTSGRDINEYTLSTPWSIVTAAYTQNFSVSSQELAPRALYLSPDSLKLYIIGTSGDSVYEYDVGFVYVADSQYSVSITNIDGQINSTTWTGINNMTADQIEGSGEIYYAISTDNHNTWRIIDNSNGERVIAQNNNNNWEINNSNIYSETSWISATSNTELDALQESLTSATYVIPYAIESGIYDNISFNVSSQDTNAYKIIFNSTGSKMYMLGRNSDSIYQYSLSTSYRVDTASYDGVSFSFSTQDSDPLDIVFNSDGTKLYIFGNSTRKVYQYNLATAYNIATASYAVKSFSGAAQSTSVYSVTFNATGTKMYLIGSGIFQYSLSNAYDISTATYDSITFTESQLIEHLLFNNDGTRMYLGSSSLKQLNQYTLTTPYDISTATKDFVSLNLEAQDLFPYGYSFSADGTKLYMIGSNDIVYQYSISKSLSVNLMDKTQLETVVSANHYTLGSSLDLMIALFMPTNSTNVPSSDGVVITRDEEPVNKGAILGVDYDYYLTDNTTVAITSNASQTLKIRIL